METSERLRKYLPKTYKVYEFFKTEHDKATDDIDRMANMLIGTAGTVAVFAVEFTLFKAPQLIPKVG